MAKELFYGWGVSPGLNGLCQEICTYVILERRMTKSVFFSEMIRTRFNCIKCDFSVKMTMYEKGVILIHTCMYAYLKLLYEIGQ